MLYVLGWKLENNPPVCIRLPLTLVKRNEKLKSRLMKFVISTLAEFFLSLFCFFCVIWSGEHQPFVWWKLNPRFFKAKRWKIAIFAPAKKCTLLGNCFYNDAVNSFFVQRHGFCCGSLSTWSVIAIDTFRHFWVFDSI